MEYLSTSEASKKWNISRRRITLLATEGRINGTIRIGSRWMIPSNAEKPIDGRKKPLAALDEESDKSFRFRIYDYRTNDNFDPPLTKEEVILRKMQEFSFHANLTNMNRCLISSRFLQKINTFVFILYMLLAWFAYF